MSDKNWLERYARQIAIDGFGQTGQERLSRARVMIAGTGGLGSPVALYLTAAGVGQIHLIDYDVLDEGNLNRQILYSERDVGKPKVIAARERLELLNSNSIITGSKEMITEDTVADLVGDAEMIIDATDNFPTRRLLNRIAVERGIPFFHAAVYGFEGTITTIIPGRTPCLSCLYKHDPPKQRPPVIGVAPAVLGSIQATEVIKYIVDIGEMLTGRLLIYDGLSLKFMELSIKRDPNCNECKHLRSEEE